MSICVCLKDHVAVSWLYFCCGERDSFKAQTAFQSFEWIRMDVSRTRWLVHLCHMLSLLSLSFLHPLFSLTHSLFMHYCTSEMSALCVLPSWEDEGWTSRHSFLFSLWSPLLFPVFFLFHPAVRNFLSPWCLRSVNVPICILLMTMGKNLTCVVFVISLVFSEDYRTLGLKKSLCLLHHGFEQSVWLLVC